MNTAREFRKIWKDQNPKVIHIPSEYELGLMEQYAKYYHQEQLKPRSAPDVGESLPQDTDGCGNDRDKCSCKDWGGCPVD